MTRKRSSASGSDAVEEIVDGTRYGILRAAGKQVVEHLPRVGGYIGMLPVTHAAHDVADGKQCETGAVLAFGAALFLGVARVYAGGWLRNARPPRLVRLVLDLRLTDGMCVDGKYEAHARVDVTLIIFGGCQSQRNRSSQQTANRVHRVRRNDSACEEVPAVEVCDGYCPVGRGVMLDEAHVERHRIGMCDDVELIQPNPSWNARLKGLAPRGRRCSEPSETHPGYGALPLLDLEELTFTESTGTRNDVRRELLNSRIEIADDGVVVASRVLNGLLEGGELRLK